MNSKGITRFEQGLKFHGLGIFRDVQSASDCWRLAPWEPSGLFVDDSSSKDCSLLQPLLDLLARTNKMVCSISFTR